LLNKEKIIKIKQKTYSLLEVSTAHGLPNIVRAKNVIILIMWSIITSLSTCAGLYFVINDIINFLKYDTVTVLEAVNEQHSQFPTISICGYPPLNTSIDIPDGYDFPELLIHIHNHSLPPYDMENGGYWLKSGSWNYYEIEREFYSFLDEPYNDCLKDVSSFAFNKTLINFISKRNRMYSQDYCYYLCSSLYALEESNCSCASNLNNFDKDCLRSYTDVFESNKKKCVAGYLKEFREKYQHEKCSKYCPLECDSMNYLINNYFELFPDSGQISLKAKSDYDLYNFSTYEEVSKHFIDLSIYYKNLKYKFISQNPKTEMFNFISNIGGLMGVFLGVSFLSFIEIFEILYEIIIILFFN